MGDHPQATARLTEGLALSRQSDDLQGAIRALRLRGLTARWQGRYTEALPDLEEALVLSRQSSDEIAAAMALCELAVVAREWHSDNVVARSYLEEALEFFRRSENHQKISECLFNLGSLARTRQDLDESDG